MSKSLIYNKYEFCRSNKETHLLSNFRNSILLDESFKYRTSFHPDSRSTEEQQISPTASPRSLGEPNEYVTLALAAEAERVRLLELVTLLNQRLDKERNEADALAVSYNFCLYLLGNFTDN